MSAYQNTWYEFDGPVKCEVEDGYILRVYGREFTSAFLRGTYTEVELWARPLKTSILIQHLDWAEFQFGPRMEYVEFYLDIRVYPFVRNPVKLRQSNNPPI